LRERLPPLYAWLDSYFFEETYICATFMGFIFRAQAAMFSDPHGAGSKNMGVWALFVPPRITANFRCCILEISSNPIIPIPA
jgi:hypothetical protein